MPSSKRPGSSEGDSQTHYYLSLSGQNIIGIECPLFDDFRNTLDCKGLRGLMIQWLLYNQSLIG